MGNFLEFFKNNKVVSSIVGIGVVGGVGYFIHIIVIVMGHIINCLKAWLNHK